MKWTVQLLAFVLVPLAGPPAWIALHPVGAAVGNVRNDGPGLVAPAADLFTA